jgi:mRNA interferase MazF
MPRYTRQSPLQILVEILMRPQGFQVDQAHCFLAGVTQQVQLALAAKFVHPKLSQVALIAFICIGVVQRGSARQAPQQGEIVWIDFDLQSGHEQAGRRPALVLSKTAYNQRIGRAFVCPITSKVKGYPFEVPVNTHSVTGVVLSDHLKNVDWVTRNTTTMTVELVSDTALQSVWRLIESMVDIP